MKTLLEIIDTKNEPNLIKQLMAKKKETRGRKAIQDKKAMLRIYIEQSVIDANGGKLQCETDWSLYLKSEAKKKKNI